jgi:hypothetical protein
MNIVLLIGVHEKQKVHVSSFRTFRVFHVPTTRAFTQNYQKHRFSLGLRIQQLLGKWLRIPSMSLKSARPSVTGAQPQVGPEQPRSNDEIVPGSLFSRTPCF